MNKTKRVLSFVTSFAMAASAFSALVIPASAAETPVQTTLQHTAMFKIMARETATENQVVYELDGAETYANSLEKSDWVSTALMQFSIDDENVDFSKVSSATLEFKGTNVHASNTSTLSVYSTGNADYDASSLDINSLYNISGELGTSNSGTTGVTINADGALGGVTEIVKLPDLAGGFSGTITADITDYIKSLSAGTKTVSLAVSNSNRGVTIPGKGATNTEEQPKLNIVLSDEVTYEANIKTNAYAKVTVGEDTYYTDGSGLLTIDGLTDGTSIDYIISKTGHNSETGNISVSGDDANVEKYLVPSEENVLYTENFEDIGVAAKGTLFNYANSGGNGTAGLRYNNGGMEFFSTGNGTRSGWFSFAPAIDASATGAYKISFDLSNLYMSQNKSGTFTSEINFVDGNDNVIFGVIPTFTDGPVSTGLQVKAGENVQTVTTDDLGGKTLKVEAEINNGTVTVTVDQYAPVTLTQADGTENIITGMRNANSRLIFATLDNIVISKLESEEPAPETTEPVVTEEPAPETTEPVVTEEPAPETTEPVVTEEPAPETTEPVVTEEPAPETTEPVVTEEPAPETTEPVVTEEPAPATTEPVVTEEPAPATTEPVVTEEPAPATTEPVVTEEPAPETTEPVVTEEPAEPTPVVVEKEGVVFEVAASDTDRTAVAVKATYNDDNTLASISFEDVEIKAGQTEVEVAAPTGTKVMLWNNITDMQPLADAEIAAVYTVEVMPTDAPATDTPATDTPATDTPATDEPAPEVSVEPEVYLEDDFSSYTSTGVTAQGKTDQSAEMGNFIVNVGARGSGGDGVSNVSLENGAIKITSGGTATSQRGGSIALNAAKVTVPAFADVEDGAVIDYSFKAMFTDSASTIQLFGITSNETTSGGQIVNDPYLSVANNSAIPLNEWVTVDAAVTNDKSGYITIKDADGAVIYSAAITASGDTFEKLACYGGTSTVYVDDFKVETKAEAYGTVSATVKDKDGQPVADASVTFDGYTVLTDASGAASAVMPNGTYTVTAAKNGYEHTEGEADNAVAEVVVASDTKTVELSLSLMEYTAMPEEVTISGGQDIVIAPKEDASTSSAQFTVNVKDQYGIEMDPEDYTLQWAIYPAGTTTADPNVTVENGVISVSRAFSTADKVAAFDLEVAAFTDDRNNKVTKTVYIANNDVIFYDPFNWSQAGGTGNRSGEQALSSSVAMPDMMSVTMTVNFVTGTEGNANIALNSNAGKLVGLQLTSDGIIKAWTGWTGEDAMNQSGDVGKFTDSLIIAESYANNTPIDVTFVIDKTNKQITVSCGTVTGALTYSIDATELTSVSFGHYRNYGAINVSDILIQEPDNNYLSIAGDFDFAKVSGQTITRTYELGQSVIVLDETFNWTVTPADQGVTIADGVISVTDAAVAGDYTITVTSSVNAEKTASETITVGDFQQFSELFITGARAIDTVGETTTYALTHAVDTFGDEVSSLVADKTTWTSSDTDVAEINNTTGELTAKAAGTTEITATITNGTAVTEEKFDVTVGTYSLTGEASGNSTTVDTSALVSGEAIANYLVTTADAEGNEIKSTEVAASEITDGSYDVDTTGAAKYEIAPIYSYNAGSPATLGSYTGAFRIAVPADTYNFVVTADGGRCDVYANSQMLVNNILQGGAAVNSLAVNDIVVTEGYIDITTADYGSGASAANSSISLTLVKSPTIVNRTQKMYVLGDSLVCIYYNGGNAENNAQTGWGQVLQNYVKDIEVVDLGNSGVTANGLLGTAFTQVLQSSKPGDIMVLESGYNDRTYDTEEVMTNAVTSMVEQAKEIGVEVVLVSPNTSHHGFNGSVAWTRVMEAVAESTETDYIDLSQLSYDFLYSRYGSAYNEGGTLNDISRVYNVSDRLHSTFNGANMCASIVAQGLYDLGYTSIVNTDYTYSFIDGLGETVECKVTAD